MNDRASQAFTTLDWIGAILAVGLSLALLIFPFAWGRSVALTFEDLNAAQLPSLTTLVLSQWFAPLLGTSAAVGTVVGGASKTVPIGRRRACVVAGFLVALIGFTVCLVGAYLPMFEIAGAIKAD
jgi:hypothetical protein